VANASGVSVVIVTGSSVGGMDPNSSTFSVVDISSVIIVVSSADIVGSVEKVVGSLVLVIGSDVVPFVVTTSGTSVEGISSTKDFSVVCTLSFSSIVKVSILVVVVSGKPGVSSV